MCIRRESMYLKNHDIAGTGVNFWWIELGGEQDTILDAQEIHEELIRVAFGVWDHIKNRGDHGMENWELEWVGFLPGKRESRRYEGAYMLSQRDLEEGTHFEDAVAFGGWTMDNHDPKGFRFMGYSSRHI
ncbi:MAG: FAD-dependent oxidoreductase, partial [Merdibacter sp.]